MFDCPQALDKMAADRLAAVCTAGAHQSIAMTPSPKAQWRIFLWLGAKR
jgi:hypothetical protein